MKLKTALKIGLCCCLPMLGATQDTTNKRFTGMDTMLPVQMNPVATQSKSISPRTGNGDTLLTVIVSAFGQNRALLQTPAAVALIDSTQLERFGNTSILPAFNTQPGVKMEERSPGSYRLN